MSADRKKRRKNAGKVGKTKNSEEVRKPENAENGGNVRWILIAAVLLAAVLIAAVWRACGSDTDADPTNAGSSASGETEETEAGTVGEGALPEIQNTESLTLSSVYTSDILNPDCGLEYAEEVASLEVTNSSDRYLVAATLEGIMSDGTEVTFQVYDLPVGATAEVFDTGNQTLDTGATCTSLICTSEEYLDVDADVLFESSLKITASGQDAVLTNTGSGALENLTVVYRCDMAGQYFGGASYTVTIDSLAAGESYTLSDTALFGAVGVVRVYQ